MVLLDTELFHSDKRGTKWRSFRTGLDDGGTVQPPPGVKPMPIGCSQVEFDTFDPVVTNTGAKSGAVNAGFAMRRSYDTAFRSSFSTSSASGDPGRGTASAYSYTPGTGSTFWAEVLAGSHDSELTAFFNSWPAGHPGTITYGHEPENNSYNLTDYRNAQAYIGQLFHASTIDTSIVKFGIILTGDAYRSGSADQYYPSNMTNIDFVGIDYYEYWRPDTAPVDPTLGTHGTLRTPAYLAGACVSYANSHGKPVFVGEHALHPDPAYPVSGPTPGPSHARPERFQATIDYFDDTSIVQNGTIGFCIYHSKLQPNHGPWWWDCMPNYSNLDDRSTADPDTVTKLRNVIADHQAYPWT